MNAYACNRNETRVEADGGTSLGDGCKLSAVIYLQGREELPLIDETLFSLATQHWNDLEIIIVWPSKDSDIKATLEETIKGQPWLVKPPYRSFAIPAREGANIKSVSLNHGLRHASGRFITFLNAGDLIYQHGYATLITRLNDTGGAVIVGGFRRAAVRREADHWFVKSKDAFPWCCSPLSLLRQRFMPLHAHVIDRARLGSFNLYFDEVCASDEDFDFLSRLHAAFAPDVSKLYMPVCEYREELKVFDILTHGMMRCSRTLYGKMRAVCLSTDLARRLKTALSRQIS